MTPREKAYYFKLAIWLNLVVGFYTLWIASTTGDPLVFVIGSLNIGVWVFNRHKLW